MIYMSIESRKHPFDLRFSLPLFFKRYYFVLLMGKDKRSEKELLGPMDVEQRHQSPAAKVAFFSVIFIWALLGFLGLTVATLYVVKSIAGINLVAGSSPFQEVMHWLKICHNL
jgi:hypothetical protein